MSWPIPDQGPEWHALMNGGDTVAGGGILNRYERGVIQLHLGSNP